MWKSFLRKFVLGTEREAFSDAEMAALRAQFGLADFVASTEEERLLELASYYAWLRRAGAALPLADADALTAAIDRTADQPCSPFLAQQLKNALSMGSEQVLLLEALLLLSAAQQTIAPISLPAVLDEAAHNAPHLTLLLHRCMGARGRWLVQTNPEWRSLWFDPEGDTADWKAIPFQELLPRLKSIRIQAPARILSFLVECWKTENSVNRVRLLALLATGLSLEDEDFLEHCLDDKSKEVRRKAIAYLRRLPGSRWAQRMQARLDKLVENADWMGIALPERDADWERDWVDTAYSDWEGSEAVHRLARIVSAVPLAWWNRFETSPADFLERVADLELRNALWVGWWEAAMQQENADWLFAFYQWSLQHAKPNLTLSESILEHVFQSHRDFHQLVQTILDQVPDRAFSNHPVIDFISQHALPLDDRLVLALVRRIQAVIKTDTHFMDWNLQGLLNRLAYFVNPDLYERFQQGWDETSVAWASWRTTVTYFLNTVRLRRSFYQELGIRYEDVVPALTDVYNASVNVQKKN